MRLPLRKTRARRRRPASAAEEIEEIAARAARLGITAERVLEEYGRIAFADLGHIVRWGPDGLEVLTSAEISAGDRAAVSEIVGPGEGKGPVRVKLYNKKTALDAIARHLGMFPLPKRLEGAPDEPLEDPLEEIQRRLARIAAVAAEDAAAGGDDGRGADRPEA